MLCIGFFILRSLINRFSYVKLKFFLQQFLALITAVSFCAQYCVVIIQHFVAKKITSQNKIFRFCVRSIRFARVSVEQE